MLDISAADDEELNDAKAAIKQAGINAKIVKFKSNYGPDYEATITGKRSKVKKWFLEYYSDERDWEFFLNSSGK